MSILEHSVKNLATALESLEVKIEQAIRTREGSGDALSESAIEQNRAELTALKAKARSLRDASKSASTELGAIIEEAKSILSDE